jgi:hypothetical protein
MRVSRIRLGRVSRAAMQAAFERRLGLRKKAKRSESSGRPVGKVEGSWVTDLAEIRQSILLCSVCDAKWKGSAKQYGYEVKKSWDQIWGGVVGDCDGCRQPGHQRKFYAHESLISKI